MSLGVAEILGAIPKYSALVVGDICLDRWCTYDPAAAEPSRETSIPRIAVVSTEVAPGGGGNVANNLASLGIGRAAVLGVLGDDGPRTNSRVRSTPGVSPPICWCAAARRPRSPIRN
jgi:bifunctional ADP-heptose synthase (sugar kinase/adenylyltransferase)